MISLICGILTTDWYKWTYLQNRNETYRHRKQTYSYQSVRWGRSKLGVGINIYTLLLLLLLSRFSRVWLCDPIDGSPPGSPVPGILQARTLEWVAISFSNAWKWKVKVKSLSRVQPSETSWTTAFQAPLSVGFSRQEYWSGVLYTLVIPVLQSQVGEFPGGSGCKEFACNAGNLDLTPG